MINRRLDNILKLQRLRKMQSGGNIIDQLRGAMSGLQQALGVNDTIQSAINPVDIVNSGNIGSINELSGLLQPLLSNLFNNNSRPIKDNLTPVNGFFGFQKGGNVKKRRRTTGNNLQRRQITNFVNSQSDFIKEVLQGFSEDKYQSDKQLAKDIFNDKFFDSTPDASSLIPISGLDTVSKFSKGGKVDKKRLGGDDFNEVTNPDGNLLLPGMASTFSPLLMSNDQMISQLLRRFQLGGNPSGAPQGVQNVSRSNVGGVPVDPRGLLANDGPVIVPSRNLTFDQIDTPTLVMPIPGQNAVLELPFNVRSRDGKKSGSGDKKSKKRRKRVKDLCGMRTAQSGTIEQVVKRQSK